MSEPGTTSYQPFPAFTDWIDVVVDESTFDGYASMLDELRAGPDTESLTRAVSVATRAAAIDTGAIEGLYEVDRGFTMTVARGVAAWEAVLAAREPVVRRSFEDAMAAYDFVLDLATSRTEVSEKAIREIHELICAGQETYRVVTSVGWQERPLPKGEYKDTPNNPTSRVTGAVHAYASPIEVPAEMSRLVRELRSPAFEAAHPVLQAAWAHYAFVAVHPFADGNGRVARALASVFLYRRPGVPLVIFADQKDAYLDGLERADAGIPEDFVQFVLDRVADVAGLVQVSAQSPQRPATASIAQLRETLTRAQQFPPHEVAGIASRLLTAAYDRLRDQMSGLNLPHGIRLSVTNTAPAANAVGGVPQVLIQITVDPPADTTVADAVTVVTTWAEQDPVFVIRNSGSHPEMTVQLRETFPTFSGVLELKLQVWIEGLVDRLLVQLDEQAQTALRQRGFP